MTQRDSIKYKMDDPQGAIIPGKFGFFVKTD